MDADALQPGIFPLQLFESFDLTNCQPAVFVTPAVIGLFRDASGLAGLDHELSLVQDDLRFTQHGKNLSDGVTLTWQMTLRSAPPLIDDLDRLEGVGSIRVLVSSNNRDGHNHVAIAEEVRVGYDLVRNITVTAVGHENLGANQKHDPESAGSFCLFWCDNSGASPAVPAPTTAMSHF